MRTRLVIGLCLLTWVLSACGFQLRGNSQLSPQYNPLYLQALALDQRQTKAVKDALTRAGAELVAQSQTGAKRLQLSLSEPKRQKLVDSSLSGVELVQISMSLQYRIDSSTGEAAKEMKQISQSVDVELDTNNVLSHAKAISRAQQQLENSLIRAMIFQLGR